MSIDSSDLRDALRPQDGLAAVITLLGLAIAVFLPDSIVKLIGACIAVLGGIAFYMTLRGRVNDRVRIRQKRTTLPPPSFKTNISTDPKTSATRIRFDDFQERFNVEENQEQERPTPPAAARRQADPVDSPAGASSSAAVNDGSAPSGKTLRFDDVESGENDYREIDDGYDDQDDRDGFDMPDSGIIPLPDAGEGFRIVGMKAGSSAGSSSASAPGSPVQGGQRQAPSTGSDGASNAASTQTSTQRSAAAVPTHTTARPEEREAVAAHEDERGAKRKKKKRGGKKQERVEPSVPAGKPHPVSGVSASRPIVREAAAPADTATVTGAVPSAGQSAGYGAASAAGREPVSASSGMAPRQAELPIAEQRAVRRQIQMVLDELSPLGEDDASANEPRAEFVRLVNQVLKAVARSSEGRSIVFFWVNQERGHFIPEAAVTQQGVRIRLGERIPLGNDLISQIARGGVPEIITNISPAAERELAPYYNGNGGTASFVGVPVYFRHEVVGVLAADSIEESSFDEGAVATLAEYTLLISQLIRAYTEKFDLYLMRQSVEAFESLNASLTGASLRPAALAGLLVERVTLMFDTLYAAVILYDKEAGEWSVPACRAQSESLHRHLLALQPDMRNSLAGEAARRAEEIYRPQIAGEMRIAAEEQLNRGGSFLAVPLMAATKCYGSLVLGHQSADAYVPRDIDLLRDLTRYVAMAIEVVNTNEALEEHLVFDEETGLYNKAFFVGGLEREIDRARDFKTSLAFALLRVEIPTNFAPERAGEIESASVSEVGALIAKKLRPYDLLGRYSDDLFSVALVGRSDQEAYLWAERLRKEIAGHIIPIGGRTFSVTVSAGVCDATSSSDKTQVLNGARQALDKAGKDGGNMVVIY